DPRSKVVVFDRLTYAGNLDNLADLAQNPRYRFLQGDICDRERVRGALAETRPDVLFNLAAESHVDRSIDGPSEFVRTNVVGTFVLLEAALAHWRKLGPRADNFRFHHVSTDQGYGALTNEGRFTEDTRYDPRSPYSASKVA